MCNMRSEIGKTQYLESRHEVGITNKSYIYIYICC